MKRRVCVLVLVMFTIILNACAEGTETVTANKSEAAVTEQEIAQEEIEPENVEYFEIDEAMSSFADDRAWVEFYKDGYYERNYAIIDKDGNVIWSVTSSELGWDVAGFYTTDASDFKDGISCLYAADGEFDRLHDGTPTGKESGYGRNEGMILINTDGEIIFDSRTQPEGTKYYYLGYGDGVFLAAQNIAGFSSNEWYLCEINTSGEIVSQIYLDPSLEVTEYFRADFEYYGNGVFMGKRHDIDPSSFLSSVDESMLYDKNTHTFVNTHVNFNILTDFNEGSSLIDAGRIYQIDRNNLLQINEDNLKEIAVDIGIYGNVGDGLITTTKGIYNYQGELISSYPEDWNILELDAFSGGYAAIKLQGADESTYVTVIDQNCNMQYEPKKVDSCTFPSYQGYVSAVADGIGIYLDPQGNEISRSDLAVLGQDFTIGDYEFKGGFVINENSYYGLDGTSIQSVCIKEN